MIELERCLDFLRAAEDRETREAVPFRFGTARLDQELPHVYDLNLLRVEHGEPTAEELVADAEEIQGGAGLAHRRVQLPAELHERLGPSFRELGWETEALVVMAQHRDPERAVDLGAAQEVERSALTGAWTVGMRSDGLSEEVVRELLAHKELIAASSTRRATSPRAPTARSGATASSTPTARRRRSSR